MSKYLSIVFKNRDFTSRQDRPGMHFMVNSYDFAAIGGCHEASISALGGEKDLWDVMNWLRLPVEIYDPKSAAAWWGYVHEVNVRQDALEAAATMDSMVNRVAVAYSYVEPGKNDVGRRKTTPWVDDLDSQAEFGVKEYLKSASGMSDETALNLRDSILAAQAWPQGGLASFGSPRGRVRYSGHKKSLSATIKCKGWWNTLGWRYPQIGEPGATEITHDSGTPVMQDVGTTTARFLFQQIATGSQAVNALTFKIYVNKVGSPAQDMEIYIWKPDSNNFPVKFPDGSASNLVAWLTIPAASIGSSPGWITTTFTMAATMEASKVYPVVLGRVGGGTDNSNYYQVGVETGLTYTTGLMRIANNSLVWAARSPDADLLFAINRNNDVDTAAQISDVLINYGQYFAAVDLDAPSGITQSSYQSGDKTALAIIEGLMAAGGPNKRRLLSQVDIHRRVQIYEEPDKSTAGLYLNSQAQLFGPGGVATPAYRPPVGAWCRLRDVMPAVVDLTKLLDPSVQFLEGSSWDATNGSQWSFKGKPGVGSVLSVG